MKKFVIRAFRKDNGAHIYSHTNNITQRLVRLKYNILSVNGQGTAVFDRFSIFIGCSLDDIDFEIYPYSKTINASEVIG